MKRIIHVCALKVFVNAYLDGSITTPYCNLIANHYFPEQPGQSNNYSKV